MTNKIKAEKNIYGLIEDIVKDILIQMEIPIRFFPAIKIDKIEVKGGAALYNYKKNCIKVDITKARSCNELIYTLMHECEHLWQFVYYPEIMKFFVFHYELYMESYHSAFNLPEADAKTIQMSNGRHSLRDMFEKYDINFFKKHINDWESQVSSMQEAYHRSYLQQDKQTKIHPLVQIQDQDMISYNSRFLEFQRLIK